MFFEKFRAAAARLPAGLIRAGAPASAAAIAAAERALGAPLPDAYASFLRSFDGADLFHESIVIAGVGPAATRALVDLNAERTLTELVFAETASGDRFLLLAPSGRVVRARGGSDERVQAGGGFASWLDATIAREQILYGPDGEFVPDAFEPDGEEVTPRTALRQAERALRLDPESAEAEIDRGVALRRLGRAGDAAQAFQRAAELDAANPWPWFDLGRTVLDHDPRRAREAFARAAALETGDAGARFLAWAARAALAAGDPEGARAAREEGLRRAPDLAQQLRRAVDASAAAGDEDAAAEGELLVSAMDPATPAAPIPARLRLRTVPSHPEPSKGSAASYPEPSKGSGPPAKGSGGKAASAQRATRAPGAQPPKAERPAGRPPPGRPRRPRRAGPRR